MNEARPAFRLPARRSLLAVSIAAVVGALVAAAGAVAQSPPPPGDLETFEGRTRVLEVQVPVNVVDRNGRSVRGLTVEDFVIEQDGIEQEISSFQIVDLELIEPDPSRPEETEQAIPSAARRYFLFLFDLSFSAPTAVVRAREAARDFVLNSMHPTDLAAVATHSIESGPKLIMTFSPDRAQLARAIDTLGAPRLLELKDRDPLRFLVDLPDIASRQSAPDVGGDQGGPAAGVTRLALERYLGVISNQIQRVEKSYARGRISSWTSSMQAMAGLLGGVEGRKHVVFFSEGFDGRLLLGRQPDEDDPEMREDRVNIETGQYWLVDNDERFGNTHLHSDMQQMLSEFRRANAVIQAVDISGLSADRPQDRRGRRVGRDALFYIANDTGGTLFEEANDFGRELSKVLERSNVTYVLSYRPSEVGAPGDVHKIKVRADGTSGIRLSYRTAFEVPQPYKDLHPFEKGLLAADLIATATPKNELEMSVLAAPFRANEQEAYVPVIVELAGEALLRENEDDRLAVEIFTYVTNDQDQMKDFFTQVVTLDLTGRRDAFSRSGLKYYGHVSLEPGRYLLRVLARNANNGRTAVKTARVEVPVYAEQAAMLLPPFFIEEPGTWFLVREQESSQVYQASRPYPFTVNGEPYVPAAYPELGPEGIAELCLVGYNLGEGELEVDGSVLTAAGERVEAGTFVMKERTITGISGLDKLLATFDASGLEAGDYTLEVSIRNPQNQQSQQNSIPFRVPARGTS